MHAPHWPTCALAFAYMHPLYMWVYQRVTSGSAGPQAPLFLQNAQTWALGLSAVLSCLDGLACASPSSKRTCEYFTFLTPCRTMNYVYVVGAKNIPMAAAVGGVASCHGWLLQSVVIPPSQRFPCICHEQPCPTTTHFSCCILLIKPHANTTIASARERAAAGNRWCFE